MFSTEEDASAQRTIEQLDEEIANLQALSQPADYFVANPSMLADQIYSAWRTWLWASTRTAFPS